MDTETYTVRVCKDCGAQYSSGSSASSRHTQVTGHTSGFKTVKKTREKQPLKISYQPGYEPKPPTISEIRPTVAAVGGLDGFEAKCSCGLLMRSSLRSVLDVDIMRHLRWHEGR